MGKIIAIANRKGGVGKTTTAINLSAAFALNFLAEEDKNDISELSPYNRPILLEMDSQENASRGIGARTEPGAKSMQDVILNPQYGIEYALHSTDFGVDVVPAVWRMADLEIALTSGRELRREYRLYDALRQAKGSKDYPIEAQAIDQSRLFIVDCPPNLGMLAINAFVAADSILVVLDMGVYAWDAIEELELRLEEIEKINPNARIAGVICNKFDARSGYKDTCLAIEEEARRRYGDLVFKTKIPVNARIFDAPAFNVPVQFNSPDNVSTKTATALYDQLAEEIKEKLGI
jgi:chromosome partitioning protein